MLPYFVGGLLPGLVTSLAFYFLVRTIVEAYQRARRARLARPTAKPPPAREREDDAPRR